MATNVTGFTELATVEAHPSGTLGWAHVTVDLTLDDTSIDAAKILQKFGGSGNATGIIIQACDAGGVDFELKGGGSGLSLCTNVDVGSGDITFRSYSDGSTAGIQCNGTVGLELIVMARF